MVIAAVSFSFTLFFVKRVGSNAGSTDYTKSNNKNVIQESEE